MECPYCRTENAENATKCAACATWMVENPPVREWTRAQEGRQIAGVCRGLANRFGVPVAALRLMFIGSLLLGGWGVVAYIALWIALPQGPAKALDAPVRVPPLQAEQQHEEPVPEPSRVMAPLAPPAPVDVMPSP